MNTLQVARAAGEKALAALTQNEMKAFCMAHLDGDIGEKMQGVKTALETPDWYALYTLPRGLVQAVAHLYLTLARETQTNVDVWEGRYYLACNGLPSGFCVAS